MEFVHPALVSVGRSLKLKDYYEEGNYVQRNTRNPTDCTEFLDKLIWGLGRSNKSA